MDGDNVAMLQRMLKRRPPEGERCDFCATPVGEGHGHLIELEARRILCACRPCYLVFQPAGAALGKYRTIPTRYREIADFSIDDAQWDALQVPIGLAFFFYNSLEKKFVAFYPSPAGATESLLSLETWDDIVSTYREFGAIEPDVEAIVIQRTKGVSQCFIVPIDSAYELVGTIRQTWRGFDGGEDAHARIARYFERARERCRAVSSRRA